MTTTIIFVNNKDARFSETREWPVVPRVGDDVRVHSNLGMCIGGMVTGVSIADRVTSIQTTTHTAWDVRGCIVTVWFDGPHRS